MTRAILTLAALGLVFGNPRRAAADVTLTFDTLPSAQGWIYDGSGPEAQAFSADGTALHQNTVQFDPQQFVAFSQLPGAGIVNPSLPFELDLTARVTQSILTNPLQVPDDFGFCFGAVLNGQTYLIGLSTDAIQGADQFGEKDTPFDNSVFHNYQLTGTPGGTYDLYVDGRLVLSGNSIPGSGSFIEFGDGTFGQNAQADITNLQFSQHAVPEPATDRPVAIAAATMAAYAWLRRKIWVRTRMLGLWK
jgi:hypothetical protein